MGKAAGKPILLVEDDADIRDGLRMLLEGEGYAVELAQNGREALNVLEHIQPFVILLDTMMPIMDGNVFLATMRRQQPPNASGVPVLMLTAAADRVERAPEILDIIRKPIDFDHFLPLLRRLHDAARV